MTQAYKKVMEMKSIEIEITPKIQDELDEVLGDLNPRYFEESMKPREALQKVRSMGEFNNYLVRPF
ncbi:MAG: hypothetical protein ACFE8N_08915 [Promethearchaeota archaeon]